MRAAEQMIDAMREFGRGAITLAPIVGRIAVPMAEAISPIGRATIRARSI